ncbi:MAG: 4-alpha-glucanotransferase [Candidatus Gastranaerophilales bacterium]|nr:4-alpha-glucanotransferase [Candidatus Gastranaerophilales bacterium]
MTYCDEQKKSPFASIESKEIIKEALNILGKKHFAFICHANSFPAESGKNTGFGTVNSNAAKKLMNFLSGIFTDIQLGPAGKTKSIDASPYTGTIFSNNPLFIDLEQLTTEKWHNILSIETYQNITENNPNKDINRTAYSYIFKKQEDALKEAYQNFKNSDCPELKSKFEEYKLNNAFWLEKDSLYEALETEHGNDYWPMWKSETDKCLFNPQNEEQKEIYNKRINELKEKYADIIDYYSFCQFVISVQNDESREYAQSRGMKMIADRQVAFSDRDNWAYQAYFLKGWCLGCPPDYFSEDGQMWGFPVMDPEKLFNKDGSLGEGGLLMKELYKKMFRENPGGVRIDHMVGLIDPWVYVSGKKPKIEEGAGRLYSSPEHPVLSRYAIAQMEDLNNEVEADKEERILKLTEEQIKKYGALVENIVIAAAKEVGLDKDSIVCEDLGTLTYPVVSVMKEYDLQGMKLIQFVVPEKPEHPYRCKNITPRSWAMVGTHDNEPIAMWADSTVYTEAGYLNGKNLAEDLMPDASDEEKEEAAVRMSKDAVFLTQMKLVELFACKAENIQMFFTDFLGLYDVYNRPGTSGDKNWSLRVPDNYEEVYCNNLKNGKALNLPLILKLAIEARGKEFAMQNQEIIQKLENLI